MRKEIEMECDSAEKIPTLLDWVDRMTRKGLPAGTVVCRLGRPRRTLDQNSRLWPMLQDIKDQCTWDGMKLSRHEWKDLFTASLKSQKPVQGINGGVVFLGGKTSRMTVRQFCELIDFIEWFGNDRQIEWSRESKETIDYARARRDGSQREPRHAEA